MKTYKVPVYRTQGKRTFKTIKANDASEAEARVRQQVGRQRTVISVGTAVAE